MTPDLLMKHFDRISEAPDAISRLRRFILDLGVRGKLVEQYPQDEPASELLKRIAAEKQQLVREGVIPSSKPPSQPCADQLPFDLKPGWQPARFSQILVELQTGPFGSSLHQSDYEKNGTPVINPASIKNGRLVPVPEMAVGPQTIARLATFKLRENDIVMARRGEMGRCAIVSSNERGWLCGTGSLILRLPKCVFHPFIVLLIGSPLVREYLSGSAVGATMQNLNQGILLNLVIALPPFAEQRRIVAKVDELMAFCDRLEAVQVERNKRRRILVAATNHHLVSAADPGMFRRSAGFYFSHFPSLTSRSEDIVHFRETILSLAVCGKLVPQNPADEPVSDLVKRLGMQTSPLEPYPIPSSWEWLPISQIGDSRLGKMLDKGKNKGSPKRYLRNTNVRWFDFDLSDVYEMRFEESELEEFCLRRGDILICEGGEPGRAAVWDERETHIYFQKALHRVRFSGDVNPHFLVSVLRQSANSGRLATSFTGVGIKHLTGKGLASFLVPVPPLAEQDRIVARVDALMKLCYELDARITRDAEDSRQLLEAVLSKALGINEISEGRGFDVDRKTNNLCPEEGKLHERTI